MTNIDDRFRNRISISGVRIGSIGTEIVFGQNRKKRHKVLIFKLISF